jgi:anti-sigma factor RsiW
MEAWRAADLHAYVDDCLEPDARLAFETQMAQDPALARRAALWRAQNGAIRAAFDGESVRTFSISIVRHQNETSARARRPAAASGKPSTEPPPQVSPPTIVEASRSPAKVAQPDARRLAFPWRLGLAALSLGFAVAWAPAATVVPAQRLAEAGVAAFQAFARPGVEPVEFATSEGTQAQAWLGARLNRPVSIPAVPSAMRLIGARITPYPHAPAAFLIYKSPEGALGLLIRSFDAPPEGAPQLLEADGRPAAVWTQSGQGLALVGDPDAASLLKIATEVSGPPAGAAQAMPDRGW